METGIGSALLEFGTVTRGGVTEKGRRSIHVQWVLHGRMSM